MQELQEHRDKVKTISKAAGLFLNVRKTMVLKVTQENSDENLVVGNHNVDNVEDFKYLGTIIPNNLDDLKEVRRELELQKLQ